MLFLAIIHYFGYLNRYLLLSFNINLKFSWLYLKIINNQMLTLKNSPDNILLSGGADKTTCVGELVDKRNTIHTEFEILTSSMLADLQEVEIKLINNITGACTINI